MGQFKEKFEEKSMKIRKSNDVKRIKNIIDGDRFALGASSLDMITLDITDVLNQYLTISGKPEISLDRKDGRFFISITAAFDVRR